MAECPSVRFGCLPFLGAFAAVLWAFRSPSFFVRRLAQRSHCSGCVGCGASASCSSVCCVRALGQVARPPFGLGFSPTPLSRRRLAGAWPPEGPLLYRPTVVHNSKLGTFLSWRAVFTGSSIRFAFLPRRARPLRAPRCRAGRGCDASIYEKLHVWSLQSISTGLQGNSTVDFDCCYPG